jgi:hypothetical protein
MNLYSLTDAKSQAKALRKSLAIQGTTISHAQALELVAHQNGARDWNTLQAKLAGNAPPQFQLNDAVRGQYLGQDFTGRIVALSKVGPNHNVSIQLDAAVDTVQFDSFSNMRSHIRGIVGPDGLCPRKTSDGVPHLIIDRSRRVPQNP